MIYQIYFKDEQKRLLEFEPLFNAECDYFFENSVILKAYQTGKMNGNDYVGFLSLTYKDKCRKLKNSRVKGVTNYSSIPDRLIINEVLKTYKPDILNIQRHEPHNVVGLCEHLHPNTGKMFEKIFKEIGFDYTPKHEKYIFYCNFQICKAPIYKAYVQEMLQPAMEVMSNMPELMNNSHYPKPLPIHLKNAWNINFYPFHTFICERLFTVWVNNNKNLFNIIYL